MISTNRWKIKAPFKDRSAVKCPESCWLSQKIVGDDEIPTILRWNRCRHQRHHCRHCGKNCSRSQKTTFTIICITHLPQIAAYGAHNYKIDKESDDSSTYTTVIHLRPDEKSRKSPGFWAESTLPTSPPVSERADWSIQINKELAVSDTQKPQALLYLILILQVGIQCCATLPLISEAQTSPVCCLPSCAPRWQPLRPPKSKIFSICTR